MNMANSSVENKCGCLYFYRKKGISQPCYLTCGKTSLGSSFQCHIRIKGVENIFCILDSNDAGFTVLVNEYEDDRILVNGTYAQKYTVLTNEDHFQLGDKKFKYCKPDIDNAKLELLQRAVADRMLIGNFKRRSGQNSAVVSPLKRLQRSSPKMRRFSTGSRITEFEHLPSVSEKNITSVRSSTPRSTSKIKFSQRGSKLRHSALGALKENEMLDIQNATLNFVEAPLNKNDIFPKAEEDASKVDFKSPTPKKKISTTGNLKEIDLNSTVSSCCSPMPTRRKLYSGNLSDVSDFHTPENNVSAVSITPLNVSKKTNRSLNKSVSSLAYSELHAESQTPKSAVRGRRSSAVYRPIVEEITPVSPGPRSSLRVSSLKKASFTQRRSVNFNISSCSDSSALDSDSVHKEESFRTGAKRKRSLSDISGLSYRRKLAKNDTDTSERTILKNDSPAPSANDSGLLVVSSSSSLHSSDGETGVEEIVDSTPSKNTSTRYEKLSPDTPFVDCQNEMKCTSTVGIDSPDSDDIRVSRSRVDSSGRNVVDNSYFDTPGLTVSSESDDSKCSSTKYIRSLYASAYSAKKEDGETSKRSTRNSSRRFSNSLGATSPLSSCDEERDIDVWTSFDDDEQDDRSRGTSVFACSSNAAIDVSFKRVRPNQRSKSLNLATMSPKSFTVARKTANSLSKSLMVKRSRRSFSVSAVECVKSQIKPTRTSVEPSPPSETSISTRATYGSGKPSSECSSSDSSIEEAHNFFTKANESSLNNSRKILHHSDRRNSSIFENSKSTTPTVSKKLSRTPRKKSVSDRCTRSVLSLFASDKSVTSTPPHEISNASKSTPNINSKSFVSPAAISLLNNRSSRSVTKSQRSSVGSIASPAESENDCRIETSGCSPAVSEFSRTSNSITYSFVDSSTDSSLNESLSRRSRRRTRPSIDERIYEVSMPKLNSSKRKSGDESLTGYNIRQLTKTPQESKSPIVDRIDDIFKTPRAKDPTDITATEATFIQFLEKSNKTPEMQISSKAKKSISSSTTPVVTENDPSDVTGLRRLLRTPRISTPSKNNASKVFPVDKLRNTPTLRNSPRNDSTNLAERSDSACMEVVEEDLKSQKVVGSPENELVGEARIEKRPKLSKGPIPLCDDVINITGNRRLSKLANVQRSPKNDVRNILGVKKLLKTPNVQGVPHNDLTNVAGVKKLLMTPKRQNSPRNDLTQIPAFKKLMATPKIQSSPKNDLTNVAGVKKLLRTPKEQNSPRNDLTHIIGVKKLMATPKVQGSPKNDLTDIAGVKKLLRTPREQNSPRNDLTNITGVKKLMATPKIQNCPKNDLTNIGGVKQLLRTPREQNSPRNDLTHVIGVKKLMATPKKQGTPNNDLTNVAGVKKLLKTPKVRNSPKNDLTNIAGVKKIFASPKQQKSPKNDLSDVRGVKRLLTSPKVHQGSPKNKTIFEVSGIDSLFRESNDETFDNLLDKKPLRTYSKSPQNSLQPIEKVAEMKSTPSLVINHAQEIDYESSQSRTGQKQLHDPMKKLNPPPEARITATSTPLCLIEDGDRQNKKRGRPINEKKRKLSDSVDENLLLAKVFKGDVAITTTEITGPKTTINVQTSGSSQDMTNSSKSSTIIAKNSRSKKIVQNKVAGAIKKGKSQSGRNKKTINEDITVDELETKKSTSQRLPRTTRSQKVVEKIPTEIGLVQEKGNDEIIPDSKTDKRKTKKINIEEKMDDKATDVEMRETKPKTRKGKKNTDNIMNDVTEPRPVTDIVQEIVENSISDVEVNKIAVNTRRANKETVKNATGTYDDPDDNSRSNKARTRRAKGIVQDNSEISLTDVENNKVEPQTRRAKKKIEKTEVFSIGNLTNERKTKRGRNISQNNVETNLTDGQLEIVDMKKGKGKKRTEIPTFDTSNISSNDNLSKELKPRREKVTDEEVKISGSKTRRGKKGTEKITADAPETQDVCLKDNSKKETKTKRAKADAEHKEETSESDEEVTKVISKTRRGKKETKTIAVDVTESHDIRSDGNNGKVNTKRVKTILQTNEEDDISLVDKKKLVSKTRRGKKNDEVDIHDEAGPSSDHKAEWGAQKTQRVKQMISVDREEASTSTSRNTRANRGQNKKYDEVEWDTPVKTTVNSKIKKNVTFVEKDKSSSPAVIVVSEGLRRSKRSKKE